MTSNVKEIAFRRALQTIEALGYKYKIIANDGTEYGDLAVVVPKVRKTRVVVNNFRNTGYRERLAAMAVGEVVDFEAPDGDSAKNFQSAISSKATRLWGQGSHTTHVYGRTVQVLREA